MSDHRPDPLDPQVVSLLDAERAYDEPTDVEAALRRVELSIWLGSIAADVGMPGPAEQDLSSPEPGPTGHEPSAVPAALAAKGISSLARAGAALTTAAILGGSAGFSVAKYTSLAPESAHTAPLASVVVAADASFSPIPADSSEPAASGGASAPSAASARLETSPTAAAPMVGDDRLLVEERTLIEVARTALSRGDAEGALANLDRHARRFPSGRHAEEREALSIQALAALGRPDSARARADRFRSRYPGSLLGSAVDQTVPKGSSDAGKPGDGVR